MPLYEYECPEGHIHEKICSIENRHQEFNCAVCGEECHLVVSLPKYHLGRRVIFKGEGDNLKKGDIPGTDYFRHV